MKKRIVAWVLLAGFVLLLLNILVFRFYWQLSVVAYFIIMFAFLLTNGRLINVQNTQENEKADGVDGTDEAGNAEGTVGADRKGGLSGSAKRTGIGRYLDDAVVLKNEEDPIGGKKENKVSDESDTEGMDRR